MGWKTWLLISSLFLTPALIKAQEAEEYEEMERVKDNVDWKYWDSWEFGYDGSYWRIMEDIAVKINKVYLDSLIDPIPPKDDPGRELKRYYVVVNASFRALSDKKAIDPSGDFLIKDVNGRKIWTSDYEGRDVNGNYKAGMYERLNPNKLKRIYPNSPPFDEITVGAAREFAASRKMVFAVGENDIYGNGRKIARYIEDNVWLCHGKSSTPLASLENLGLREGYYEIKKQTTENLEGNLGERWKEEIFAKSLEYILNYLKAQCPLPEGLDSISYRRLTPTSFEITQYENPNTNIDYTDSYKIKLEEVVLMGNNCFKITCIVPLNEDLRMGDRDTYLVYVDDNQNILRVMPYNKDRGEFINLEDAFRNSK